MRLQTWAGIGGPKHVSRTREISIGPKQARRAHGGVADRGESSRGGADVLVPHRLLSRGGARGALQKKAQGSVPTHTFLGLLAKIKCSICSYQFNI